MKAKQSHPVFGCSLARQICFNILNLGVLTIPVVYSTSAKDQCFFCSEALAIIVNFLMEDISFHHLSCLIIIFSILSIECIINIEKINCYLVLFMDPDIYISIIRALNNYFFSFSQLYQVLKFKFPTQVGWQISQVQIKINANIFCYIKHVIFLQLVNIQENQVLISKLFRNHLYSF